MTQLPIQTLKENINKKLSADFFCNEKADAFAPDYHYNGGKSRDLFGLLDVFLINYILDLEFLKKIDKPLWFNTILEFQGDNDYFIPESYTNHSKEHGTAYAISILKILSAYCSECRTKYNSIALPEKYIEIIRSESVFKQWFRKLGFEWPKYDSGYGLKGNLVMNSKKLGWHNIWPGSHIGGGVPAAIVMLSSSLISQNIITESEYITFYQRYFESLNQTISSDHGVWKRGFMDHFIKKPTHRDIGGAVHFYWIYDYLNQNYPFPEQLIESCLLKKTNNGLIKDRPYCIDFDYTYLLNRASRFLSYKKTNQGDIDDFMFNNYRAIIEYYSDYSNLTCIADTHGIPGALASLIEVEDYFFNRGRFKIKQLSDPFKEICWL